MVLLQGRTGFFIFIFLKKNLKKNLYPNSANQTNFSPHSGTPEAYNAGTLHTREMATCLDQLI